MEGFGRRNDNFHLSVPVRKAGIAYVILTSHIAAAVSTTIHLEFYMPVKGLNVQTSTELFPPRPEEQKHNDDLLPAAQSPYNRYYGR